MQQPIDLLVRQGEAIFAQDAEGARRLFEEALALDPHHVQALNNLGVVHYQAGRLEQARDALERALALSPADSNALVNLFHVHLAMEHPDRAARILQAHGDSLSPSEKKRLEEVLAQASGHAREAEFSIPLREGRAVSFRLRLDLNQFSQQIQWECHASGQAYEPATTAFVAMVLEEGDTVVDVGGHIGYFTMLASRAVGERGRVFTFEPETSNHAHLMEHVALNDLHNVLVTNALVGPHEGEAILHVNADNDGGHALWDVGTHAFNEKSRERAEKRVVAMRTLDAFLSQQAPSDVRLVKIDTEGAELGVLRGAVQSLARWRIPFIVAEVNRWGLQQMGTSEAELRSFMGAQGYDTYLLPDDAPGTLVELLPEHQVQTESVFNVAFVRRDAGQLLQGIPITRILTLGGDTPTPWGVSLQRHGDDIRALADGSPHARNLKNGMLRGCGLQFGNLKALCQADPLFTQARAAAHPFCQLPDDCLANLHVMLRFHAARLPAGHVVIFAGGLEGSAIFVAMLLRELWPGARVITIDLGPRAEQAIDTLPRRAAALGLSNLEIVAGDKRDAALLGLGGVRLAHLSCSTREATVTAYETCRQILVPGGYLVIEGPRAAGHLASFEAVEDVIVRRDGLRAEQVHPHLVYRHPGAS